jgi:hypothetical protein
MIIEVATYLFLPRKHWGSKIKSEIWMTRAFYMLHFGYSLFPGLSMTNLAAQGEQTPQRWTSPGGDGH